MLSNEIRKKFLQFFKEKNHAIIPSSPVIPADDPTLLFINAGMNQFKDVFLGEAKRDYNRAASCQKCIRVGGKHNDLENVGHTSRHLTFFEMLGNFSFGDYFKKEAISFAWEVATEIFELDPQKIYATVFKTDDEAHSLWESYLPQNRIVRLGEKDNFWQMGETGPCGPCSELLYDRGDKFSSAKSPLDDIEGERFFEFWNLVFMEQNRHEDKTITPLPNKNIDTGMGLERLVSLKMGVDNIFETDIFSAFIKEIEDLSKVKYQKNDPLAASFHVIADHLRCLSFAIADGVQPSNTDRGYVLRKILRRAVRYGRMLGLDKPFMASLVPTLGKLMPSYQEVTDAQSRIEEILTLEEESFIRTLQRGGNLLQKVIDTAQSEKRPILGKEAFKLKDTYGFPIEEILLIAKDQHLSIDLKEFYILEEEAKERSKKSKKAHLQTLSDTLFSDFAKTPFVGYDTLECETKILKMIQNDQFIDSLDNEGILILEKTPFYAEMGGQVGDTGTIVMGHSVFEVTDTIYPYTGVVAHIGQVKKGSFKTGQTVLAKVDKEKRALIQNNHTATHLLHFALCKILGEHIHQAGSLVDDKRLRFDFTHHKALTREQIQEIEKLVNEYVRSNKNVETYQLDFEEAQKRKEIKQIFGEKYGDVVRVVDVSASKELCGGTHTSCLGSISLCKITKETSIAKGIRRIEMVTGIEAENYILQEEDLLDQLAKVCDTSISNLQEKIENLLQTNKALLTEKKSLRKNALLSMAESFSEKGEQLFEIVDLEKEEIMTLSEILLKKRPSSFLCFAVKKEGLCQIYIFVPDVLIKKGISAQDLIKKIGPIIGGGGGGKKHFAQAGGKNPDQLEKAFLEIKSQIQSV